MYYDYFNLVISLLLPINAMPKFQLNLQVFGMEKLRLYEYIYREYILVCVFRSYLCKYPLFLESRIDAGVLKNY